MMLRFSVFLNKFISIVALKKVDRSEPMKPCQSSKREILSQEKLSFLSTDHSSCHIVRRKKECEKKHSQNMCKSCGKSINGSCW